MLHKVMAIVDSESYFGLDDVIQNGRRDLEKPHIILVLTWLVFTATFIPDDIS